MLISKRKTARPQFTLLRFFRINDPYRLVFILLILITVRIVWIVMGIPLSVQELKFLVVGQRLGDGFMMYSELYDSVGPLSAFVFKWMDLIFGRSRWVHVVFSSMLVMVQATVFNDILLRNKAYDENTYVPAFFYVVLMCGTMDFFALSPQLMSLTFILLALNYVFRRIDNIITDELFLYSGINLGIATFFYLPSVIFLLLFLLSLILFSSAVLRRLLIFLYGAAVVFLVIWAYFFWYGAAGDFMFSFFQAPFLQPSVREINWPEFAETGYILGSVGVISFSVLFTQRLTNFQQKMQQVMILLFLGALLIVMFVKDLSTSELVLFVPSITFFLVYFILGLRRKVWRYSLPYLVIFGIILYPFYWLGKNPDSGSIADVQATELSDQRLLGIGVPIDFYYHNRLAGPFVDRFISERKLQGLNYFGEASELYELFKGSEADVVIDSVGVFQDVMKKFPEIDRKYIFDHGAVYRARSEVD